MSNIVGSDASVRPQKQDILKFNINYYFVSKEFQYKNNKIKKTRITNKTREKAKKQKQTTKIKKIRTLNKQKAYDNIQIVN